MRKILAISLILMLALAGAVHGLAEDETVTVRFDANCSEGIVLEPLTLSAGKVMGVDQMPIPEREGYLFTGWFTVPEPEIVDGVPQNEWIFGSKYIYGSGQAGEVTSMPVTEDITLYARWASPIEISNVEELFSVRNDLTGWYVLTNDIDLSGIDNWKPIGTYRSEYEMANPEWWQEAFRGHFDGRGHTISGLTIEGREGFGAALFQAAANAVIENVTLADYRIEISGANGLYAAPLLALGQGEKLLLKNCRTSGTIQADVACLDTEMAYIAVTGMAAAAWGGRIENCAASGTLDVSVHVKNGAEVNVGGINGEGYAAAVGCLTEMDITARVLSDASGEKDEHTELYVGGVQGAATIVNHCAAAGTITASLQKATGDCAIAVGGIVGEERYDCVDHNRSDVQILVEEGRRVYAGGLVGRYNTTTYGMIGFIFGIRENRLEKSLSLTDITLAEGFDREEAVIGPAVSALPGSGLAAYVTENIAALDTGYETALDNPSVTLYASPDEMTGDALKDILGDGWIYEDASLPLPQ